MVLGAHLGGSLCGPLKLAGYLGHACGRETLALITWLKNQPVGEGDVNQHDRREVSMEAFGAGDVAVVGAPEDLGSGVDALHGGTPVITPLELKGSAGDGRKAP